MSLEMNLGRKHILVVLKIDFILIILKGIDIIVNQKIFREKMTKFEYQCE